MNTWSTVVALIALPLAIWWVCHSTTHAPQHAGGYEGALPVRHLIKRVTDETSSRGRHQPREPATASRSPNAADHPWPPLEAAPRDRNLAPLQRILTGLRRL